MEYYVIGEREIVLGFMLAGVKGSVADNRSAALDAFKAVTDDSSAEKIKVLILTEDVSDMLSEEVKLWQMKSKAPLIVEIPGLHGHIPGRKSLSDSIREAVGIQI
ncbi:MULTISPECIES: V-type ATP synthase subunit F [Treponema]|uniref:ATPase V n=1 Tax=Treponema rectale TaxID=744512 RepID=A0A840SB74_9SPIR|nr:MULTISPECIES: V-type ATP synthase subunit F [Treponema]MBB5218045.1 V/A-type H+-transporting ATPase subunit F [Treponema rectale]MBE6353433.1 ATPase V [Treponema sp.]MBO6176901.1 V-type ATP synthase subunit F [Treponema sp.]QOS40240.1 ATPase V [Treponema rectale]